MVKVPQHFPEQSDTGSSLSGIPETQVQSPREKFMAAMRGLERELLPEEPDRDAPAPSAQTSQERGSSPQMQPSSPVDPDVEWMMQEYGMSREKAEALAKMI